MEPLDFLMMNNTVAFDDEDLSYQRVIGNLESNIICFLPWRTSLPMAKKIGICPERFLACYAVPNAIVSSEPHLCKLAVELLVSDALLLMNNLGRAANNMVMLGFSMGSAPATMLANFAGARLCSVTSADRGDLMLWQSPAAQRVKKKARYKNYRLQDYTKVLAGYHPIDNLSDVRGDSIFVSADNDLYVPECRREALLESVRQTLPQAKIVRSPRGHIRTIMSAAAALETLLE